MTTKQNTLNKATDLVDAELTAGPKEFADNAELSAYIAECDALMERAREVKKLYAKRLAVIASQKSREARKERIARGLALLAEAEAKGGAPE